MIGNIKKPINNNYKEVSYMEDTKNEIDDYLHDAKHLCSLNKFHVSLNDKRKKNKRLRTKYIINDEITKNIIMDLEVEDFIEKTKNINKNFEKKDLYVFGKKVKLLERFGEEEKIVPLYIKINKYENRYMIFISFHEAEFELNYFFDS